MAKHMPTYQSWQDMHQRCYNPKSQQFKNYGARGISVCERWHSYDNFLADMGERASDLTIERNDVDGNYEPNNCCWADRLTQRRNQRNCRKLTLSGRTMTLEQWAKEVGISPNTIRNRIKKGWSHADALTTPPNPSYSKRGQLGNGSRWAAIAAQAGKDGAE